MPLTAKGKQIMAAMRRQYGERAQQVFYASRNKGTIKGVDRPRRSITSHMRRRARKRT